MDNEKIEDKMQEAYFFYERMKESSEIDFAFKFYLSAFLSASRSVLQYIEDDVNGKKGKEIGSQYWYDEINKDDMIKFFKNKRDFNIHKKTIKTKKDILIRIQNCLHLSDSVAITVRDSKGNIKDTYHSGSQLKNNAESSAISVSTYYFDDWSGDEDILRVSKKYLEKLNDVIAQIGVNKILLDN